MSRLATQPAMSPRTIQASMDIVTPPFLDSLNSHFGPQRLAQGIQDTACQMHDITPPVAIARPLLLALLVPEEQQEQKATPNPEGEQQIACHNRIRSHR